MKQSEVAPWFGSVAMETRWLGEWAKRQLQAGDTRKGTARDLGQMLAAEAALVRAAADYTIDLKIGLRANVADSLLAHPLVADEASSDKDEYFRRWLAVACRTGLQGLLRIDEQQSLKVGGLAVLSMSCVMSGAGKKALEGELKKQLGPGAPMIFTTVESLFHRSLATQGEKWLNLDRLFLYDGPIYAGMRSFCAGHIGRLYTLRKILTFWNGSLPNAFLTCGGWGCSHNWTETDAYRWPDATVDSGEFANDGYREQVEAVQAMAAQRPVKCPGPHGWREAAGPGPVGASVGTDR